MGKISKRDQDPRQVEWDAQRLALMREKKSPHFAVGTNIYRFGKGTGAITGMSKDGGRHLRVQWEDGTIEDIDNPNFIDNWRGRYGPRHEQV